MPVPIAQRRDRIDLFGATALIGFSLLMGLNQSLIKMVNGGMDPVFQAGLRSACAVLPVLIYALIARRRLSISDGSLVPGLICGVLFTCEFALLFEAMEFTTVSRASIFFYTMPFWLALGAHVFIPGEGMTPRRLLGLLLAVLGVALALSERGLDAGPEAWIGDLMCLVGSVIWATLTLMLRVTRLSRSSPEMQLLYQISVSGFILLVISAQFDPSIDAMTPRLWAIFAFQVLVVVSFGIVSWFWILSVYPAAQMASFSFLTPVFGVFFGWMIFGERITAAILGALLLVGLGIFLVNWRGR
ncbi:MAG: DMT family transporter [Pseudomonadota bacterium]